MGVFNKNYSENYYCPKNPDKCLNVNGKLPNAKQPYYRSSWEHKMCSFCDSNPNILEWGSEVLEIPYVNVNDGRKHKYVTDFYVMLKNRAGEIKKYICEVKPACQCERFDELGQLIMPDPPKRKTEKSIMRWNELCEVVKKNHSKWVYARRWCKDNGYEFIVLNENNIGVIQ